MTTPLCMPMSDPQWWPALLLQVGLLEYRLVQREQPLPPADVSVPLPQRLPPNLPLWLSSRLRTIAACLEAHSSLFGDPWLEFDQPLLEGLPGVFVRLLHPLQEAAQPALRTLVHACTGKPLAAASLPALPAGLRLSHLGVFAGRCDAASHRLRCNLVGPPQRQWAWLQQQLPETTQALQQAGLLPVLLANPAVSAWSATLDWGSGGAAARLGIELYPAGRLQRGSSLNDLTVHGLLQQLQPWTPAGAIQRCALNHQRHLPPGHAAGFSHLKLVLDPGAAAPLQLKLYLLSHASGSSPISAR